MNAIADGYLIGAYLLLGGLGVAVGGPTQPDDEHPTGERTPAERWRLRALGIGLMAVGMGVVIATALGFRAAGAADPTLF